MSNTIIAGGSCKGQFWKPLNSRRCVARCFRELFGASNRLSYRAGWILGSYHKWRRVWNRFECKYSSAYHGTWPRQFYSKDMFASKLVYIPVGLNHATNPGVEYMRGECFEVCKGSGRISDSFETSNTIQNKINHMAWENRILNTGIVCMAADAMEQPTTWAVDQFLKDLHLVVSRWQVRKDLWDTAVAGKEESSLHPIPYRSLEIQLQK